MCVRLAPLWIAILVAGCPRGSSDSASKAAPRSAIASTPVSPQASSSGSGTAAAPPAPKPGWRWEVFTFGKYCSASAHEHPKIGYHYNGNNWILPVPCPHGAGDKFDVISPDAERQHCALASDGTPIECPIEVEAVWEVKREGKRCVGEDAMAAKPIRIAIECPPDNADAIALTTQGTCQTVAQKPIPVPCPQKDKDK